MFKSIKHSSRYIVSLSIVALLGACGSNGNEGVNSVEDGSSQLVSAKVIEDVNTSTMLQVVQSAIDPTATNAFGYKAVKITYNTVGQDDKPVVASGLLVLPTPSDAYKAYLASVGKAFSVSMLCDNHGTVFTNAEVPSNVEVTNGLPDYSLAVLMTGVAGFAAILPDYIGYGDSNDVSHPYILEKASARASLDMIKASMKYMSDNHVLLNYQLYVSGYSEGGYIAMSLAQEIEKNFASNVNLKGVAPMAGPHDLVALGNIEIDASHIMVYPAFLGYLADSYSYYFSDIELSELVNEPDTVLFHSLFDGSKSNVAIHTSLGLVTDARAGFNQHTADALFKTSFIDDYKNDLNTGLAFKNKLKENSVYDWTPTTKMNLIHCVDDEIIPFSMSQTAYDKFIANGASTSNVTLTPIPTSIIPAASATDPFVHGRCGQTAYGAAVQWFDAIRQGKI